MLLSIASGVISGASADTNTLGLVFLTGLALFIVGLVAWYAVAQPPAHFDDINQPQYFGHTQEHDDAAHAGTGEHH